ncbi:MAG TPA: DUF2778 domain-containing protein [Xanthobacteraceae bacterium]|jgi:hypothetical protein|nr:DUF2778 domain-containing protein [Xanthobacteraceae bacterium]
MTLGARHYYSETDYFRVLARGRDAGRALAAIAAAFTFALLLCAVFAAPHDRQHTSIRALRLTDSLPYFSFLDSRFDFYFSRETFSKIQQFVPDYEQTTAALSSRDEPSHFNAFLAPNVVASSTPNSKAVQRPSFTQRPPAQGTLQSSLFDASNRSNERSATSTDDNVIQKFVARLFAKLSSSPVRLASVATDDSQLDAATITSRYDQWTAVYDISSHMVFMPDGSRLEAHSGFGPSLDDPARVAEKDRGPTPPDIYNLALREQQFHGVSAIRLIPEDGQKTLGRTGLLAHSFMLGPNGQSNGCVSFRDYDKFLRAYLNHQVKRLVVVASLD